MTYHETPPRPVTTETLLKWDPITEKFREKWMEEIKKYTLSAATTIAPRKKLAETVYLTLVPIMRGRAVVGMTVDKMTKLKPRTSRAGSIVIQIDIAAPSDLFDWSIPVVSIEVPGSAIVGDTKTTIDLSKT